MYKFFTDNKSGVLKLYASKILLIMRLMIVILTASILQVSASSLAQKVTLKENNIALSKVFREIEKQTGYSVIYYSNPLSSKSPVNVNFIGTPLTEVMYQILSGLPFTFTLSKNYVIIKDQEQSLMDQVINVFAAFDVKGKVVDDQGMPLNGATVKLKGTGRFVQTDVDGNFSFNHLPPNSILQISYVGFRSQEIEVKNEQFLNVSLAAVSENLDTVSIVSTGYQTLDKEKATGSFVQIDNKLLNRSVSTNILERLDGVTSGLIFTKNRTYPNQAAINIRGVSTIFANSNPLIVVDNFPYSGDISSINPNDVESVTVLKDAAAAAIWGAFSGNGVIVITLKKGNFNKAPKIEINSSVTIGEKPNLFYSPRLSSSNYIDVERFLFAKGKYDASLTSNSFPILSPVVEILNKRRSNLISAVDSAALIDQYKKQNTRDDLSKYLYQRSVNQQHSISMSGGSTNAVYHFSAGFDKNIAALKRNEFNRITLNASNTYTFFNKKLELSSAIFYTKNITDNNGINSVSAFPYVKLIDDYGNPKIVPRMYRQEYLDTVGHGNLLDWTYIPLQELNSNYDNITLNDYRINTSLNYKITSDFNASIQYQYSQGNAFQKTLYDSNSFYVRDLINSYTQYDVSTNTYLRPIPLGGILDRTYQTNTSQNFRVQANYAHEWNSKHKFIALSGFEVRDINADNNSNRSYGYDALGFVGAVDYKTNFLLTPSYNFQTIAQNAYQLGTTNRFISYFSNLVYSFKNKYMLSASARKDESNIFGVNTNQKGVPLWSAGISWEISKEKFYKSSVFSYLRLKLTNGYQGNVDNTLSSLVTAIIPGYTNNYNRPYSSLSNPPNPDLRWEKINTTNLGVDFGIQRFLNGSLEYYIKKGTDLIGSSPVDPTTGVSIFKGNSANMRGHGFDLRLSSNNLNESIKWNTTLLFSYTQNKVTKYFLKPTNIGASFGVPMEGYPLYSIHAYNWGRLDSSGDPEVYLDGKLSKDYTAITNSNNISNLKYMGTASPTIFGSLRNDFSFKQFSLSANITYKLGYSFRRPGLSYNLLFSGGSQFYDKDYAHRWQKPGDEVLTTVPRMEYPANFIKDQVYTQSSILVDKGDHIRLQDISFSYDFSKYQLPKGPFGGIRIYSYISNIGILWKENKDGIDPDYSSLSSGYPPPITYTLGIKANF